jgi:hypothetical protein
MFLQLPPAAPIRPHKIGRPHKIAPRIADRPDA